jgi:LacI family transcriptional regulator
MLTGLMAHLKAQGYYLLVYPMPLGEDLHDFEILLRSGRVDGIVLRLVQDPPATDALLELIAETQTPCICIEQPGAARFGFSTVTYDDRRGAYEATRYLLGQGHRRIGYIGGDRRYSTARNRLDGYTQALTDDGLPIDEALLAGGRWHPSIARPSIAQFMSLADPPTAIFAASDSIALGAIEELHRRHYRVPENIAVIGFDDSELASRVTPPLTTVRIPLLELGQRAAELMLDTLQPEHGEAARLEVLPVELVCRTSA